MHGAQRDERHADDRGRRGQPGAGADDGERRGQNGGSVDDDWPGGRAGGDETPSRRREAAAEIASPSRRTNRRRRRRIARLFAGYSPHEPMPLGGYAVLIAAYGATLGTFVALARPRLPRRIELGDFVLLAVATHKLARIVTKDWVTIPLRAPFVEYRRSVGGGEVEERARGAGLRHAMGDLLTCPWCIGPWVAGALVAGFTFAPRATRTIATIFCAVAVSDTLHHVYAGAQKMSQRCTKS